MVTPSWWKKMLNFVSRLLTERKIHYFQPGSWTPWISAQVKNPRVAVFSHSDPRDPPVGVTDGSPILVLPQCPLPLPCPPQMLTLLTASARPSATLPEPLKMPHSRFPSQIVEWACVESRSGDSWKLTWAVLQKVQSAACLQCPCAV